MNKGPRGDPKQLEISADSRVCLEYSISSLETANSFFITQGWLVLYLSVMTLPALPV